MPQPDHKQRYDLKRRQEYPWRNWYKLAIWQRRRTLQLIEQPLCENCLSQGKTTIANTAHHKTPHRGNWELFVKGDLESACHPCHSKQLQADEARGYSLAIGDDGWPTDELHPANR